MSILIWKDTLEEQKCHIYKNDYIKKNGTVDELIAKKR